MEICPNYEDGLFDAYNGTQKIATNSFFRDGNMLYLMGGTVLCKYASITVLLGCQPCEKTLIDRFFLVAIPFSLVKSVFFEKAMLAAAEFNFLCESMQACYARRLKSLLWTFSNDKRLFKTRCVVRHQLNFLDRRIVSCKGYYFLNNFLA